MRLLHTADLHVGNGRFGGPFKRLNDIVDILDRFTVEAHKNDVDLAVIAGDLFDTRRPHPREWAAVASFITSLSEACPVVITDGNHDGAVTIGEEKSRTLLALNQTDWRNVVLVPMAPSVVKVPGVATVVTTPYPHKRQLDADPELQALNPLERMEEIAKRMDAGITALHAQAVKQNSGLPIIFVGHITAAGATVGSERGMRLEDDITISTEVLDLFDYAALGHLHKQQQVSDKAWYAGAPANIGWGEVGDTKGFLLVDVQPADLSFNGTVETISSGEGPLIDLKPGEAMLDEAVRGSYIRMSPGTADPDDLYEAGARYVEVVYEPSEKEGPATDRAIDSETAPEQALDGWLIVNKPDLDVAARQPYIEALRAIMEEA